MYTHRIVISLISYLITFVLAIENKAEAARLARHLVESVRGIGTISTVFPEGHGLQGHPFSLEAYYAPCYRNGSLTVLMMPISQSFNNILHNEDHNATISVMPLDGTARASNYRVGLIGHISEIDKRSSNGMGDEGSRLRECYLSTHPDSAIWVPPHGVPHNSYFARFDIDHVWYTGGFGNSHYIGYIPESLYSVSTAESNVIII
ncbi:hypothetical protein WALSEDRAFT_70015 [Wallemia mellicola CBS 633.66]|uniref:CREG-like beta-barrel domain-containing protein n=2 Tax=Wallemia mellicola TaxID=1708541 RepID=A0A4T0NYF1_9BASI|nr:hypothetical protein WALSEDRAFT_70015 [Wallemia mellicola CBS 633.66]TIB99228.1 hypothetical protein E3Q18_01701 [Wallemia mellicola]EIM20257.1 hypothetical protein WALSEDRAFT_70015 [Wallemia mellicola CBS 633.66]TIC02700.1 hypothetical protein E3Q17_01253 [Wallemia mellicola]TIC13387.1 hypothetical protein E3Q14_01285 [Wallemia mellicola]TIC67890.1 hypothetical protein E3Q01_01105 [Wallemia mellicola]|eukprot:XP_006959745.1 hypothetical protein WALSEDRAFT_70015 [Wallemia mellicola CBS 633.66]